MKYDLINPITFRKIKESVDSKDLTREVTRIEAFYPQIPYLIIQANYIMKVSK